MNHDPLAPEGLPANALAAAVARVGAEVARPLTTAMERVQRMATTGRIDRPSLQALREEIDSARRAGMRAQQIARLAAGEVQQTPERLSLATLLREVLTEQAAQSLGGPAVGHRQQLAPLQVVADPSLVATLLRAAADWSREHACAPVHWRLQARQQPPAAELSCQLVHQPTDLPPLELAATAPAEPRHLTALDTLDWVLLRVAAQQAGVGITREDGPSRIVLTLRFPSLVLDAGSGVRVATPEQDLRHARQVAGSQVLVLAARRDVRQRVREAMQGHDLFIDHVTTIAAARGYCDDAVPQALLFESSFANETLRTLAERLSRQLPAVALFELVPGNQPIEPGRLGEAPVTRLGVDNLWRELAPLLVTTLAQRR